MLKTFKLPLIAFVTGFSLMVFELAAARLLAPTLGSSVYVWTSVIGGIIASLSLGVWVGGKYADLRKQQTDLAWLLLACALAIGAMLLFAEPVLIWIAESKLDQRFSGVLASMLLFAPTSFLVGACGPYLAKFNVKSLSSTGRSVANIDAMNALGGITGTFLTGFFLFTFLGTRSIFALLMIVFIAISWAITPRAHTTMRLAVSIGLVLLAFLAHNPLNKSNHTAEINTATANYTVANARLDGANVKLLSTGPRASQSGIYIDKPNELLFWYTQEVAAKVKQLVPANPNILVLGGGALTLTEYLAKTHPDGQVDTVEIDPDLTQIAKRHFDYEAQPNAKIISQDARNFLLNNATKYDAIIVDVYSDVSVPFALTTEEYGESIFNSLNDTGVVIVNNIGNSQGECKRLLDTTLAPYHKQSKYGYIKQQPNVPPLVPTNHIAVFSQHQIDLAGYQTYKPLHAALFTDDLAPIEPVQYSCSNQ